MTMPKQSTPPYPPHDVSSTPSIPNPNHLTPEQWDRICGQVKNHLNLSPNQPEPSNPSDLALSQLD
jgi:hypothetical protein